MIYKTATETTKLQIVKILKEILIALRLYNLYPANHPISQQGLEKCYQKLKAYLHSHKEFEIEIGKEHFLFERKPIADKNVQLKNLAFHFFSRHISGIQIKQEVSKEEFEEFISTLSFHNEQIPQFINVKETLKNNGVKNIQIKEFELKTFKSDHEFNEPLTSYGEKDLSAEELYNLLKTDITEPSVQRKILLLLKGSSNKLSQLLSQISIKASLEAKECTVEYQAFYLYQVLNKLHNVVKQEPLDSHDRYYQNLAASQLQLESHLQRELFGKWVLPDVKNRKTFSYRLVKHLTDSQLTDIVLSQIAKGKDAKKILEHIQVILLSKQRTGFSALLREKLSQTKFIDQELLSMLGKKSHTRISASLNDEPMDEELLEIPLHMQSPELEECEHQEILKEIALHSRESLLESHLNSILIKILTDEDNKQHQKEIADTIKNSISNALAVRRYKNASNLLSSLTSLKSKLHVTPYLKGLIDLIIEELSIQYTPQLISALSQENKADTNTYIIGCLRSMGTHTTKSLVDALSAEEDMSRRRIICDALVNLADEFLDAIGAHINTQEWYVIRNIVSIMGRTKNRKALEYLKRTVSHPDSRVRAETVTALSGFKGQEVIEVLKQLLKDSDVKVASKAAKQLGIRKASEAATELIRITKKFDPFFNLLDLKVKAIEALANMGVPDALPLIKKCSHSISLLKPGKAHILRETAKQALTTFEISTKPGRQNAKSF